MSFLKTIGAKIKAAFGGKMPHAFLFTDRFTRDIKKLAKKDVALEQELIDFCKSVRKTDGDVISKTCGCRKIRMDGKGKGTSGGYRVIVFTLVEGKIHFLHIYPKNEKDDLSNADKKDMRRLVEEIKSQNRS